MLGNRLLRAAVWAVSQWIGLDILSLRYPQAKQTDPNLIIDSTLVKRIEQSGFIDALYKK